MGVVTGFFSCLLFCSAFAALKLCIWPAIRLHQEWATFVLFFCYFTVSTVPLSFFLSYNSEKSKAKPLKT
jgi:hypothetical protein